MGRAPAAPYVLPPLPRCARSGRSHARRCAPARGAGRWRVGDLVGGRVGGRCVRACGAPVVGAAAGEAGVAGTGAVARPAARAERGRGWGGGRARLRRAGPVTVVVPVTGRAMCVSLRSPRAGVRAVWTPGGGVGGWSGSRGALVRVRRGSLRSLVHCSGRAGGRVDTWSDGGATGLVGDGCRCAEPACGGACTGPETMRSPQRSTTRCPRTSTSREPTTSGATRRLGQDPIRPPARHRGGTGTSDPSWSAKRRCAAATHDTDRPDAQRLVWSGSTTQAEPGSAASQTGDGERSEPVNGRRRAATRRPRAPNPATARAATTRRSRGGSEAADAPRAAHPARETHAPRRGASPGQGPQRSEHRPQPVQGRPEERGERHRAARRGRAGGFLRSEVEGRDPRFGDSPSARFGAARTFGACW